MGQRWDHQSQYHLSTLGKRSSIGANRLRVYTLGGVVQNHRPPTTDHEPLTTDHILNKTPTILENKDQPQTSKNAKHRPPTTLLIDHRPHRPENHRSLTKP